MEKQEIGDLLRLLHAARHSGVLPQTMASMEAPQVASGSMTDAGKRRKGDSKGDPETSGSDWNEVDFPKDDPSKHAVARYENDESGKVVAKELAPPAPPTDHIRHVDRSVRVPNGTPSFYEWSRTLRTIGALLSWFLLQRLTRGQCGTVDGLWEAMEVLLPWILRTKQKTLGHLPGLVVSSLLR